MISISKKLLFTMLNNARNNLEKEYKYINELNVFPVPDGDTGSNMMTTLDEALNKICIDDNNLFDVTKNLTRELLMSAHGNSGVILSQIFKGFFAPIQEQDKELNITLLQKAFLSAKEVSYKVVDKPKEGTILTVIKDVALAVNNAKKQYSSVEELFADAVSTAKQSVAKTPELLPVLKRANVVDSGAYGLLKILEGMNDALLNKDISNLENAKKENVDEKTLQMKYSKSGIDADFITEDESGLGYCCEFIVEIGAWIAQDNQIHKKQFDAKEISTQLNELGDSIVFVYDDTFMKVHIHSLTPYKVLEIAQQYGEFHKIKVDNMTLQRNKNKGINTLLPVKTKERLSNESVVVATTPNKEIEEFLKNEFNVSFCINRLENPNPSVRDFVNLIRNPKAKNVILVLDNSDTFLSAQKAKTILQEANKEIKIEIIDAKDILNSIFCILSFNKFIPQLRSLKQMQKVLKKTVVYKLAKAVKDTSTTKMTVKKGEYILLTEKKIIAHNQNLVDLAYTTIDLVAKKHKHMRNDSMYMVVNTYLDNQNIESLKKYASKLGYSLELIKGGKEVYELYIGV